jgi:hypothetical protein
MKRRFLLGLILSPLLAATANAQMTVPIFRVPKLLEAGEIRATTVSTDNLLFDAVGARNLELAGWLLVEGTAELSALRVGADDAIDDVLSIGGITATWVESAKELIFDGGTIVGNSYVEGRALSAYDPQDDDCVWFDQSESLKWNGNEFGLSDDLYATGYLGANMTSVPGYPLHVRGPRITCSCWKPPPLLRAFGKSGSGYSALVYEGNDLYLGTGGSATKVFGVIHSGKQTKWESDTAWKQAKNSTTGPFWWRGCLGAPITYNGRIAGFDPGIACYSLETVNGSISYWFRVNLPPTVIGNTPLTIEDIQPVDKRMKPQPISQPSIFWRRMLTNTIRHCRLHLIQRTSATVRREHSRRAFCLRVMSPLRRARIRSGFWASPW